MRIERISSELEFRALQQEWNAVLQKSPGNTVFLTWEWIASWWSAYGAGKQLLVLVARDPNGICLGIAPLYVERRGKASRRVKFLGDGTFDSDYLDLIIVWGNEHAVVASFLQELKALKR